MSIEEINQRINYPRRYALSLMVPFFLFVVGTLVGIFLDDLSFIDSLYFSVITDASRTWRLTRTPHSSP